MKVFMKQIWFDSTESDEDLQNKDYEPKWKWEEVFENDWDEEDLYINDRLHNANCWGDCYGEWDLEYLIEERKKCRKK